MASHPVKIIIFAIIIYLVWFVLHQIVFHRAFCRKSDKILESFYLRISGFLLLGLLTYLLSVFYFHFTPEELGLKFELTSKTITYLVIASVLLPTFMFFYGPKKQNLWKHPKIRAKKWTWTLVFFSSISWIIYLFGYEFFFRGFLFFPILAKFGLFYTILINVILYSLAHADQGKSMMIGAAIFSIVLTLIANSTNSFVVPFLIHVINALSNEWISLKYHPDIKVKGVI